MLEFIFLPLWTQNVLLSTSLQTSAGRQADQLLASSAHRGSTGLCWWEHWNHGDAGQTGSGWQRGNPAVFLTHVSREAADLGSFLKVCSLLEKITHSKKKTERKTGRCLLSFLLSSWISPQRHAAGSSWIKSGLKVPFTHRTPGCCCRQLLPAADCSV